MSLQVIGQVIEKIINIIDRRAIRRREAFEKTIAPTYEACRQVVGDLLEFYEQYKRTIKSIRDAQYAAQFVMTHKDALQDKRLKMLTVRLELEKMAQQIKAAPQFDANVANKLTNNICDHILFLLGDPDSERPGISRPRDLIDTIEMLVNPTYMSTPEEIYTRAGGIFGLVESTEKTWAIIAEEYNMLKIYAYTGNFPK